MRREGMPAGGASTALLVDIDDPIAASDIETDYSGAGGPDKKNE